MRRVQVAGGIALAGTICAALLASSSAAAVDRMSSCPGGKIRTASGCTSPAAAGREVRAIVERSIQDNGLRAALARVDLGGRTLVRVAAGESMAGVPANLRMHFRNGSIAIPYVIDLLLQLQDKGRLSLDDPVSKWLPHLPNADRVTLRMLANSTSGYADWIQENPTSSMPSLPTSSASGRRASCWRSRWRVRSCASRGRAFTTRTPTSLFSAW